MPKQDIIVIGTSAGGVEALKRVVAGLDPALPASIFVVLHVPTRSFSCLPEILTSAGPLRAEHPINGTPIEPGKIYVAPPDHHILIQRGHIHLTQGPRENRHRPAINPLFRSAAEVYRARVAGVVLTGMLDDGTLGLWEVKRYGGVTVVQDPEQAEFPSMPRSAAAHVEVDYFVTLGDLPSLLGRLAREGIENGSHDINVEPGEPEITALTCPECRGTLWETRYGSLVEFRCRVQHAYTTESMASEHRQTEETALWAAIVALEEGASLARQMAGRPGPAAEKWHSESADKERQASILREIVTRIRP